MNETYSRWLLAAMVTVAAIVTIGWAVYTYVYRRLGYPRKPSFLRGISLCDDIESICKKLENALQEEYHIKERSDERLCIEKQYDDPRCLMTVEFHRKFGAFPWSSTYVKVKCFDHPWLNWNSSSSSNSYPRSKK